MWVQDIFWSHETQKKKTVDTVSDVDGGTKDTCMMSAPTADSDVRFHGLSVRGVAGIEGRGALWIGALHRGASSLTDLQGQGSGSTSARASPLGIEGLSLSNISTPRECGDPANSVTDGVTSTRARDGRQSKVMRNKRSRSTERYMESSPALAADAVGNLELANQLIFISASGVAGLSSSSSSTPLCEDHEQQQQSGVGGREHQCQPTGRIMRPPRPRSMPSERGDIGALPLSLHGGGLNGIAICARPSNKSDVLMSTTTPLPPTIQGNSLVNDEAESNRAPIAQPRIEISRSAGSLREQRSSSNITPIIHPSTAAIGITVRPLSGIQTILSTAGITKSPRGQIGKIHAESVAGIECGNTPVPNKVGRRIRAAVGSLLRDAIISEGHSPQINSLGLDESLSSVLNINGHHQHQQISGGGIILPPPLPLRITPPIRRGRPSPYRPTSEVPSKTHP